MMIKQLCTFYAAMAICVAPMAYGESVGNPGQVVHTIH